MAALPPARLSSAMLGALGSADAQDAALVARLEWVRQWADTVAESDADEGCRKMASACRCARCTLPCLLCMPAGRLWPALTHSLDSVLNLHGTCEIVDALPEALQPVECPLL